MPNITQTMGIVTAYGAAVKGGYTGTYEEFCAEQAHFAENAQAVAQAKTDTEEYKRQAGVSAQNAATSETNASSSANSASQSATAAQGARTDAIAAKDQAVSAKDDAVTAKGAAETAQGKAEDAQASAEQAAEQLSSAVEQVETNKQDITQIKADLNDQIVRTYPNPDDILKTGQYWAVADGGLSSGGVWARSNQQIDDSILSITMKSNGYKMFLLAYENSTYIGTWFGNGFETTYDATYVSRYIDLLDFRRKYPTYQFRIDITNVSGTAYDFNDIIANIVFTQSVVKAEGNTIKKIFGDIAVADLWEYGSIGATGNKSIGNEILYKRISTHDFVSIVLPITIVPQSGYAVSITTYATDGTFEQQSPAWITTPVTISNAEKLYKIVVKSVSDNNLILADISEYIVSKRLVNTPFDRLLSEYANVKAVNHRGYNAIAPENTLPAFEMSASLGFKYVECDVLFTSDGVPVIMHDATINRTCCNVDGTAISGDVAIDSVTYADLIANYDACTTAQWDTWKGTKVPTFEQFMNCCKALNLHPWIELKWTHTYTQAEVQDIIAKIKKYGMEEHVTFISFSYDALALVASEWDTVELGLNGTVVNALALKTGKNRVFMIYDKSNSFADAINAGLQVCVYTVNTVAELAAITAQGYDSILTNKLLPSQVYDTVRAGYEA